MLNINATITETTAMLCRLIGENIEIKLQLDPHLPAIEADDGMIEQMLINLAVNARDAMPRGGLLLIRSRVKVLGRQDVRRHPRARAGSFACLSIADSGCGIPPQTLPRIFEPFFTTKEAGKGTGIGLATVASIVEQHHGWIEVETEVGAGTRFHVYLPVGELSSDTPPETEQTSCGTRGVGERILIVEDDAGVREMATVALRRYGYHVLQARSGDEAMGIWQKHGPEIDLLVTDLVLPHRMSGTELAAALESEKPDLPVIFFSGYMLEMAAGTLEANRPAQFVPKPFAPDTLTRAARKLLDVRFARAAGARGVTAQTSP